MANTKKIKGLTVEIDGDILGLRTALSQAKGLISDYDKQLKALDNSDPLNSETIAKKQEVLQKAIAQTEKELQQYQKILESLKSKGISKKSTEWIDVETRIINANNKLESYKQSLNKIPTHYQAIGKEIDALIAKQEAMPTALESWSKGLKNISETTEEVSKKTKALSALAVAGLTASAKSAIDFESNIASIKKVVTDLTEGTINDLKNLSVDSGIDFSEISSYASMAGTLGIAEKDISAFAESMVKLNTSTDGAISGEEGAKSVARFLNLVGQGTDQVGSFGSALVYVADQFATTADEVLATSSAMAGLSSVFNVDENDLIGISAVLQSLGVTDNVSASTFTKVFSTIEQAVDSGGEKMEKFAQVAGYSAEEFSKAWKDKPMQVVLDFADGLQGSVFAEIQTLVNQNSDTLNDYANVLGMTKEQFIKAFGEDSKGLIEDYTNALADMNDDEESAISILSDLSLSNVRYANTLLKLSGHGQEVKEAIQDSNKAWKENSALTTKANVIYQTTEAQLKGAVNSLKQAGATLGDELVPYLKKGADAVKDFSSWFSNLNDGTKSNIVSMTALVALISPLSKGVSTITALSSAITGLGTMGIASLGATGVAIAGIAVSGKAIYDMIKPINDEFSTSSQEILDSIEDIKTASNESYTAKMLELAEEKNGTQTLIENLGSLQEAYISNNQAGEDNATTKERINDVIAQLNEQLPNEKYYFDETTGSIKNSKDEIVNLRTETEAYYETLKRQAVLDEFNAQIEAMESKYQELGSLIEEQRTSFNDIYSQLDEHGRQAVADLVEAYEQGLDGIELDSAIYSAEDIDLITQAGEAWKNASVSDTAQEYRDLSEAINQAKENVQLASSQDGEAFWTTADLFGIDLSTDWLDTSYQELMAKREEIQTQMESAQLLGDTASVSELQEQLNALDEQIASQQLAQSELIANMQQQQLDSIESVKTAQQEANTENANQALQALLDNAEPFKNSVYEPVTQGGTEARNYLQNEVFNTPFKTTLQVDVQYNGIRNDLGGVNLANGTYNSGGFNTTYNSGGFSNSGLTYQGFNAMLHGLKSGGYASGGITLNNTFNITNGNNIDSATVQSWSAVMVDYINEELGKAI